MLSENLQKCDSLNRVLLYPLLWSSGDTPGSFCAPLMPCVSRVSPSTPWNSDPTFGTQPNFTRKLSLVASKRGICWHVSLSLWHFYNLPLAVWGENLAPVPKGKYCVYWPPSPPEQLPEPSTSQKKERKEKRKAKKRKEKKGREGNRERRGGKKRGKKEKSVRQLKNSIR